MANILVVQNADLNGQISRIIVPVRGQYSLGRETSIPPQELIIPQMDSAISPPLSDIELADILESEREFSSERVQIYDNAEDFISNLRAIRLRSQREGTE